MDDFQEIVRRIRNGDSQPLKQIYASMTERCIKYIQSRNGTADDAKDLLQDSLYIFFKRVMEDEQFTLTAPAEAFIFRIFQNKWFKLFKSKGYKNTKLDLDEEDSRRKNNIADEESLPDDFVLTDSEHPVSKLMDQLGKDCKKVLLAFYVYKQGLEAIAEDLDFTYKYVKLKRFRCMEQLRNLYFNN